MSQKSLDNALFIAAEAGEHAKVDSLLKLGADRNAKGPQDFTPLTYAAQNGHEQVVRVLLDAGAQPDPAAEWTPLLMAASEGHLTVAEMLVEAGADIEKKSAQGATPILLAAQFGQVAIVRYLIAKNASTDTVDERGSSAWLLAARNDHVDVMALLLEHRPDMDVTHTNAEGLNAAMLAAYYGHAKVCEFLGKLTGGLNDANSSGITALMLAAQNGHLAAAQALLAGSADPSAEDPQGMTALKFACMYQHADIIKLLVNEGNVNKEDEYGRDPLGIAAYGGDIASIKALLDAGAIIDHLSKDQLSALMLTIVAEHEDAAVFLIDSGADLTLRNAKGFNVLMLAAHCGLARVTEKLLSMNVNPNEYGPLGHTPLQVAVKSGHMDIINLLLGAESLLIDLQDEDGWSALMLAAHLGKSEAVRLLLAAKANPNLEDKKKRTPLIQAAYGGYQDVVQLLVSNGAKLEAAGPMGWTALLVAASAGEADTVLLLHQLGANLCALSKNALNVLHLAAEEGHADVVEAVLSLKVESADDKPDIDAQSGDGETALHIAAREGFVDVIRCLNTYGARVDIRNRDGLKAVEVANRAGRGAVPDVLDHSSSNCFEMLWCF